MHQRNLAQHEELFLRAPQALQAIPDTRDRSGLRYPLPNVLTLVLGSGLADGTTLADCCDFGRGLGQDTLQRIGAHWSNKKGYHTAPCESTLHYILKRANVKQAE